LAGGLAYRIVFAPPCPLPQDEGFHQLIASQWDAQLSAAAVASWLATMDAETGWIPREQILGAESRARVPPVVWMQRPDIANPPTLHMPVLTLAVAGLCRPQPAAAPTSGSAIEPPLPRAGAEEAGAVAGLPGGAVAAFCARRAPPADAAARAAGGCRFACGAAPDGAAALPPDEALAFLRDVYPRLAAHYRWYNASQAAERHGGYRWRGATQTHTLASGLDDYPRGLIPSDADEHVDLLAWMAMSARVLAELAAVAPGAPAGDAAVYAAAADAHEAALLAHHWDVASGTFCDVGVVWVQGGAPPVPPPPYSPAEVPPGTPVRLGKVCHAGYVSLMPLLMRALPPGAPELAASLDLLEDRARGVWTRFGLRSLSSSDPGYAQHDDYWRGAVWLNMNYLAVAALRYYGAVPGPHAARAGAAADRLAKAMVRTVADEFGRTGFLWEQYLPNRHGIGRGTHPFTGWSALVALMVAGRYPF